MGNHISCKALHCDNNIDGLCFNSEVNKEDRICDYNIRIKHKFAIGQSVRLLKTRFDTKEITCPFCKGSYKVKNPNFLRNGDVREFLTCPFCEEGTFVTATESEKECSSKEIYRVECFTVFVENTNKSPIIRYVVSNKSNRIGVFENELLDLQESKGMCQEGD